MGPGGDDPAYPGSGESVIPFFLAPPARLSGYHPLQPLPPSTEVRVDEISTRKTPAARPGLRGRGGDARTEIVTGPGPSALFGAHVRGWNYDGDAVAPVPGCSFLAWPSLEFRYGVTVAVGRFRE